MNRLLQILLLCLSLVLVAACGADDPGSVDPVDVVVAPTDGITPAAEPDPGNDEPGDDDRGDDERGDDDRGDDERGDDDRGDDDRGDDERGDDERGDDERGDDDRGDDDRGDDEQLQAVTGPGLLAAAGVNPMATRSDGQCLPEEDAGSDQDGIEFNLAYQVVGGELGALCFGSPDETVVQAWRVLADLTPPGQLRDLAVFAGFESAEQEGVTLALVQGLNDDGTDYLMAVNITETMHDWDEATLTMAHEFTHVFTALPGELDRTVATEDCTTFDNGEGCYAEESIINQWFGLFWHSAPGDPTDEVDGEQRCSVDSGFFGDYAASTPEEDFAESFSAYVLRIEPKTEGQRARLEWIDQQAGLREFKDRAVALNYGPLAHNFDACG